MNTTALLGWRALRRAGVAVSPAPAAVGLVVWAGAMTFGIMTVVDEFSEAEAPVPYATALPIYAGLQVTSALLAVGQIVVANRALALERPATARVSRPAVGPFFDPSRGVVGLAGHW